MNSLTPTQTTHAKGFTLVELMVTVSIVGILAGMSIVAFTRNWRDERVKAVTRESTGWLEEIRRIAIQRGAPCVVVLNKTNATFDLLEQTGMCDQPAATAEISEEATTENPSDDITDDEMSGDVASDSTSSDAPEEVDSPEVTEEPPSDDVASFEPRVSIQGVQNLVICATDIDGADPATVNLECGVSQSGSNQTIFTPRGTVTNGLLIKLHLDKASSDRCIAVVAPLGQVRSGRANPNGTCNFETAY